MGFDKKAQERQWLEVVRTQVSNFPTGPACISESPDFLVMSPEGLIGVEITTIHRQKSPQADRAQETERQKMVEQARLIYEQSSSIPLHVDVCMVPATVFDRRNRQQFASRLAALVLANIPPEGEMPMLHNPYIDRANFPFEFSAVGIARRRILTRNTWYAPLSGVVQGDFVIELQTAIEAKDELLPKYEAACIGQWLIVVGENSSPSTFLDPSEVTLKHAYRSNFNRIFLVEGFRQKVWELIVAPLTR